MNFDEIETKSNRRETSIDFFNYFKETLSFATTFGLGPHYIYGYTAALKNYEKSNNKLENKEEPPLNVIISGSVFGLGLFGMCAFGYYKAYESGCYEFLSAPIVGNLLSYFGTLAYYEIKERTSKRKKKK